MKIYNGSIYYFIVMVVMICSFIVFCIVLTSCSDADVESTSESSEVTEVSKVSEKTEGIVTDKYDYISHNHYDTSEVYMIGYRGNNEDGIACERYIRVTSVIYQSLNIGDKFDMNEHERKG